MDNRAMATFNVYVQARDKAGYTDYAVAKKAGIRQSSISDWKHGRYTPKADKLYKIAEILEIPFDMFMR